MDATTQTITLLVILTAWVLSVLTAQVLRRRRGWIILRPLNAYKTLPIRIGAAIEANHPVHVSLGGSGLDGTGTLTALAGAELAYQVASRAAIGDAAPILSTGNATALPLLHDTLRRAYRSRNLLQRMPRGAVQWYAGGNRSLAFAAALTGLMSREAPLLNVAVGDFGAELALLADAAARHDQHLIATSTSLEGQAVAYAAGESNLIGEEVFVARAYLENDHVISIAGLAAQDVLRILLLLAITFPVVVALIEPVSASLRRFFGGG